MTDEKILEIVKQLECELPTTYRTRRLLAKIRLKIKYYENKSENEIIVFDFFIPEKFKSERIFVIFVSLWSKFPPLFPNFRPLSNIDS